MAGKNIPGFEAGSSLQDFPEDFNFLWRSISESSLTAISLNNEELDNIINQDSNQQQMVLYDAGAHQQAPSVDNLSDNSLLTQSNIVGKNFQSNSLPALETWPGEYNFTVSFNPQQKSTKGIAWTYSDIKDKLYVGKDVPCPVNFSCSTKLPNNVFIRVTAFFATAEHIRDKVTRCVNHSMDEIKNGVEEAEHLIRCESAAASYHTDAVTGRHSVFVPFENPAAGQQYSTYIYKFACFGSCSGGPNRRPLLLIFTLEMNQQVIGRRKLDVKICACPGRDRKTEEAQCNSKEGPPTKKPSIKESSESGSSSENHQRILCPVTKKRKRYIEVDDDETYEFVQQIIELREVYLYHKRNLAILSVRESIPISSAIESRPSETAGSLSEEVQRVKEEKED